MTDTLHTPAFHSRRRSCIGGSDAPAIIGAARWGSRLSVYLDKVEEREPSPMSSRMEWGLRLEDAIAEWWMEQTGIRVRRAGFRRHPELDFVGGHPDRLSLEGRTLLEIKTADHLDDAWGEDGSEKVPADYFVQVQHYLAVTGAQSGEIVVLVRGNSPQRHPVPRDEAFIRLLLDQETAFWRDHVVPRIPPDPDGSEASREALARLYPRSSGEEIVATPEVAAMMSDLLVLRAEAKALGSRETELENAIKAYLGERSKVVAPGAKASWSERNGSVAWKTVAASLRRQIESIGESIRSGDFDAAERYASVDLDALESLYRGDPVRTFRIDPVKQKDGE